MAPPDGGYGWVVVAAGFVFTVALGNVWSSFGLLYPEYVEYYHSNKATVGWVGSLSVASGNFLSVLFSAVIQQFGVRVGALVGTSIFALGLFLSAFAPNVYTLYITYGLILGGGSTMTFLSVIVAGQQYFKRRRTLASGLMLSGISCGTVVCGPFVTYLIEHYGPHGTLIILSATVVQTLVFCTLLRPLNSSQTPNKQHSTNNEPFNSKTSHIDCEAMEQMLDKEKIEERKEGNFIGKDNTIIVSTELSQHSQKNNFCSGFYQLIRNTLDFSLFLNVRYTLLCFSSMLFFCGHWGIMSHFASRAFFYGVSANQVAIMLSTFGVVGIISRVVGGLIGVLPCVNRTVFYGTSIALCRVNNCLYTLATDFTSMFIFGITNGIFSSFIFTVQPTVVVDQVGVERVSHGLAIINIFTGIGALAAAPFIGFVHDVTGNYELPFHIVGGMQVVGGALCYIIACLPATTTQHHGGDTTSTPTCIELKNERHHHLNKDIET